MDLKEKIDIYEGFPEEGISFKDINSLIIDPKAYREAINDLYEIARTMDANKIASPESRGYIIGCPLAYKLGVGIVPVRKPGKLPGDVCSQTYFLEYGTDSLEVQRNAVQPGDRFILVDDLLATGGTLKAAAELIEALGGEIAGVLCLIELTDLGGRKLLKKYPLESIIQYNI